MVVMSILEKPGKEGRRSGMDSCLNGMVSAI